MESRCLYRSVSFCQYFFLTYALCAGRGSGYAPRIDDVSSGKGDQTRQAAQRHYDSYIKNLGHDTR
jgi:hypothetical protein